MAKVLRSDCTLQKHEKGVYLRKIDESGPWHDIHPLTAATIALFNGRRSEDEVTQIVIENFGVDSDKADWLVKGILIRYPQYILEKEKAQIGLEPNPNENLNPRDFIFRPVEREMPGRLDVPARLIWYVTRYCYRQCIYCYAGSPIAERALDSTLSTEEVKRIINEAADLGVCGILLTGGEPFLRKDLPEIVEHVLTSNMDISISTKYPLNEDIVKKMKGKGEKLYLKLSFDSPNEKTADLLTSSPGFWRKTVKTMELLKKHGIPIRIAAVITSLNIHEIPELVNFVYNMGAKIIGMVRYGFSEGRHQDKLFVSDSDWQRAYDAAKEAQAKIGDTNFYVVMNPSLDPEDKSLDSECFDEKINRGELASDGTGCAIGRSIMMFRWDGKVAWCDQGAFDDSFVCGDLTKESIIEVWNSDKLKQLLHPNRELYRCTDCYTCEAFEECTYKSACYVKSKRFYGSFYVPLPHYAAICGHYHSPLPPRRVSLHTPGIDDS